MNLIFALSSANIEMVAQWLIRLFIAGIVVLAIKFPNQRKAKSESNSERSSSNRNEELGEDEDSHDHHHGHDGHDGDGE